MPNPQITSTNERRERETHITLDIPVVVLAPNAVSGLHEPRCREPDVHIYLPPLQQLKSISDRFARLASSNTMMGSANTNFSAGGGNGGANRFARGGIGGTMNSKGPKLDLAATMHGSLRLSLPSSSSSSTSTTSSHLSISSTWRGLENPELDTRQIEGGEDALARHPSTRMREVMPGEDDEGPGWAKVRIDARDWSRVLGVGRVGGRVVGCESTFTPSQLLLSTPSQLLRFFSRYAACRLGAFHVVMSGTLYNTTGASSQSDASQHNSPYIQPRNIQISKYPRTRMEDPLILKNKGFCKDHALILYCYMPTTDASETISGDESVITYYISSISR